MGGGYFVGGLFNGGLSSGGLLSGGLSSGWFVQFPTATVATLLHDFFYQQILKHHISFDKHCD